MSESLAPAIVADRVTLYMGDTVAVLPLLDPESVDSIITDPPYGLQFCDQTWDGAAGFRQSLTDVDTSGLSDAEVFEAWCHAWAVGALHVLKPGGLMAAFGGTRTWHRMVRGVLAQEMTTLTTALRSADLNPSPWLTPTQVAVMLRTAYDPAASTTLDRNPAIGRHLDGAGPLALDETWDQLRSDSAYHAVLWISEWPRSQVFPGFLAPLMLSTGIRRSFTLIATPLRADVAAKAIRRKKTEHIADQAQRAKIGQIEDASQTAEYHDVLQQEADLASGHGICRFTGLIAISAPSDDELQAGVASVEQAAVQASCETRLLVGQQSAAFTVAALPLCRAV